VVDGKKNGSFRSSFGNVLVLSLLGVGEVVVFRENCGHILDERRKIGASNDSNSSSSNISESNVESSEFRTFKLDKIKCTNNEEKAEGSNWVFLSGEEFGVQFERQSDFVVLVEVRL
jgi:hypothetical protein